jgi:hypothetical protein
MRRPLALTLLSLTLLSWPASAQFSQQGPKLLGTGGAGGEEEGYAVAISADGNTAIVGAPAENHGSGAAWIWTRSGGIWTQNSAKLVASDAAGTAAQGTSVGISADGRTVIVGGPGDNGGTGAAWIWTRNGDSWIQPPDGKLFGLNPSGFGRQGSSVSLSADANTAIIGAPSDGNSIGAAWIFTRTNGVWIQQKLVGIFSLNISHQGVAVAVSADGNTAIVGAPSDGNNIGAAWIWNRSGGTWIQEEKKLISVGSVGGSNQGSSVALSADGNTAIIGGIGDRNGGGAAWVWTRSNGKWNQQPAKLVASDASLNAQQGISVSISADGTTALIGGYLNNTFEGAAWIWTLSGGLWTQQGPKLVGSGAIGNGITSVSQGWSVSLSGDGNTAIVGGFMDNGTTGAAWIWIRSPGGWTQQGSKLVGTGAAAIAQQGSSVALSGDGNTAIVGGFLDNHAIGAAWVWTRNNGVWSQQGTKLAASDPFGNAQQGFSVSLSADGNTAVVGGYTDLNGGAAWIWNRSAGVWTQETKLSVFEKTQLGYSAALSADGSTVILGGPTTSNSTGSAFVWARVPEGWKFQGTRLQSNADAVGSSQQGTAVSLSADGNTAIVGGPGDNSHDGAAWVWIRNGGFWLEQTKLIGFGAIGHAQQGTSVSISADGNTALVGGPADDDGAGAVWVWTQSRGTWSQQAKLVGSGAEGKALQGRSLSLSADGNTAIVGGYRDNSFIGAAWIWTRAGGVWTEHTPKLIGSAAAGGANQAWSVFLSGDGTTAILGGPLDNNQAGAAWIFTAPPQRRRASRH